MNRLSPRNLLNALAFPMMLLLVITPIMAVIKPALSIFWIVAMIAWIYFAARQTYNLFYDSQFIYLKGLAKKHKVALGSIRSILLRTDGVKVRGLNSWRYSIAFQSELHIPEQSVWIKEGNDLMEEFVNAVRALNVNVDIRHHDKQL